MPKVLVINGHGAKLETKVKVDAKNSIITPGDANNSYVTSFDNQHRHLEEMTAKGKIWPLTDSAGEEVKWHKYNQDTSIHDIAISPLQKNFKFSTFSQNLINGHVGEAKNWSELTDPPHNVMECGALAVKKQDGIINILEGQELKAYLQEAAENPDAPLPNGDKPLFFCDKALGKIKPMGTTSLSEINQGIAQIKDFSDGTDIIVATCSPDKNKAKSITVMTKQAATEFSNTNFVTILSSPDLKEVNQEVAKIPLDEPILMVPESTSNATQKMNLLIKQGQEEALHVKKVVTIQADEEAQQHLRQSFIDFYSKQDPNWLQANPPPEPSKEGKMNLAFKSDQDLVTFIQSQAVAKERFIVLDAATQKVIAYSNGDGMLYKFGPDGKAHEYDGKTPLLPTKPEELAKLPDLGKPGTEGAFQMPKAESADEAPKPK